jgi:ABC-type transport system substrate-binding protein
LLYGASIALAIGAPFFPLPAAATPHVLVWADGDPFRGLNPLMPATQSNTFMNAMTMAYLTTGGNGPLEPELAVAVPTRTNGGISRDGRTVTFRLRPNLKWSDGQPLTSSDVVFTVRLLRDPATAVAGRTGLDLVSTVAAPDPRTVVFHLAKPYAPIAGNLFSDVDAPILPQHLLHGGRNALAAYLRLPAGAGPFRYARQQSRDRVELDANPYYFRGAPKLAKIVYRIIAGDDAVAAAIRAGDVDVWPATAKDSVDLLQGVAGVHAGVIAGSRPSMILLNTRSAATGEGTVRQALRLAIDRAAIIARSYRPGDLLGETVLAPAAPGYSAVPIVPFDIAKARALLHGRRLRIVFAAGTNIPTVDRMVALMKSDLRAAGIELDVRRYPARAFFAPGVRTGVVAGGHFDAAYVSFGQFHQFAPAYFNFGQLRVPDLEGLYACANVPPHGPNYTRLCDPALDALFARYDTAYDPTAAAAIARRILARLDVLLPAIVVSERSEYYIVRDTVTGLKLQPFSPFGGGIANVDVTK